MKYVILAGSLAIGCLFSTVAAAQGAGPATPSSDIIKGCESCHGPRGDSKVGSTPRLNGQQAGYIARRLRDFLDVTRESPHATNSMWPVVSNLNDDARDAIGRYFAGQPATSAKPGPLAAEGKRIYENGIPAQGVVACGQCHGAGAEGHDATPRLAGQHADYLKSQMWNFSLRMRENDLMHPKTEMLSEHEIDALASYLASE